ncbi:serine hydrolase domain-containing protein [Hyalangium rubrum]|uniref:Serine hydrolase n=1 Tax=Hyalangium rubrum TaxID=3103134 RepID=A0ABU5GX90_9BACT|nr:serine hydrolase [Hyalangium sp. s54d21]MDY7225474.1 serine hydrolase [Hyalangium sp. s54d21]
MSLRGSAWILLTVFLAWTASAAPKARAAPPPQLPPGTEAFPSEVTSALEVRLQEQLAGRLPAGLSVGVSLGDFAWTAGFGFRNVEKRLKATPRTTYRTASVAKSFTAIAILQLVEAGTVGLDDDIRTWVPDFPEKQWPVTVRQLLGHLGGVSHYRDPPHDSRITRRMTTAEAIAIFKDWPLVVEPGTEFTYTTYGYNLLGAAVEKASGLPFGEYLSRRVFTPAGMKTAAMDDYRTRDGWHAVGYRPVNGGIARSHRLDLSSRFGGGGARASVVDLLAFGRAVMASTLVTPETTRMMQMSMETRDGRLIDYGMGFAVYPTRGHYIVAHAGGQPETSTFLLLIPAERLAIAVAMNLEAQDDLLRELIATITEFLLEGGTRRRAVHAADPADEVLHEGLYRIYSYGRAFYTFNRAGYGLTPEPGSLPRAFTEASALLSHEAIAADPRAAQKKLKQAHHPRSERLFIRVGMHMAERIASAFGPQALSAYPAEGALPFFEDYLRACEQQKCAEALQFSPGLRADIVRLVGPWRRANAPELRPVLPRSVPEMNTRLEAIERAIQGVPLHPDFTEEVLELAQSPKTPPEETTRLLDWALRTHPASVATMLARADAFLLQEEDAESAELLYRRAFERPTGADALSPEKLLARAKKHPAALEVLRIAVKLHPNTPPLWQALAAREKEVGNADAARAALEQANGLPPPPAMLQSTPTP